MNCLLCQSDTKPYFNYGKYSGQPYGLARCAECGLAQTEPMPGEEVLRAWYQRYDVLGEREPYYQGVDGEDPWNTPAGRDILLQFVLVKHYLRGRDHKILDVGSGPGLFLDLARRAGWQAIGIELNAEAAERARKRFGVDVRSGAIESVDLPAASFDAVTLWDIFEHVRDPLRLLARVKELLRPGGWLFIETPNVRSTLDWAVIGLAKLGIRSPAKTFYGLHHLTLWHPKIIRQALEDLGFAVKESRGRSTDPGRTFRGKGFRDTVMRAGVGSIQWWGKFFGRQNKIVVIAQKI